VTTTEIAGQPAEVWLIPTGVNGGVRWAASLTKRPRRRGAGGRTPPHNVWTGPPTEEGKSHACALLARDIEEGPFYA
jgi:hypothetical protein